MGEEFLIFVFGMLALTSAFLCIFFANKAVCRFRKLERGSKRHDRYLFLAAGIATFTLGVSGVTAFRAIGNIIFGVSPIIIHWTGPFIEMFLYIQLIGAALIVWLADLETSRRHIWLWGMALIGMVWAALTIWLVP